MPEAESAKNMEFNRLDLKRYKPFQSTCRLDIRPLTILVGANNAGKSALARAIPMFAGALRGSASAKPVTGIPLESFGLNHGDSFEDLIADRSVHGNLCIQADFQHINDPFVFKAEVQNVVSPGEETRQVVTLWELDLQGGRRVMLDRPVLESDRYRCAISNAPPERIFQCQVNWDGLLPRIDWPDTPPPELQGLDEGLDVISEWSRGVRYLCSPRELIASPFHTPERSLNALGANGREAPRLMAVSEDLQRKVRRWFQDAFGLRLEVRQQGDISLVEVREKGARTPVAISQAGQGLSQVLPVAVQCMTANEQGPGVDIVEHPEAELHPRAHASVADLLIDHLPGRIRPVVIETHSEVLLLRIRRRVAQGRLDPEDVAIYWVYRDEEIGSAALRPVKITPDGEVTDWPEGVFLEDYEEVVAIRQAARQRGDQ